MYVIDFKSTSDNTLIYQQNYYELKLFITHDAISYKFQVEEQVNKEKLDEKISKVEFT